MSDNDDKKPANGRGIIKKVKKTKEQSSKTTGWGPTSAVLVTLGIYFGSQLFGGYLILQYLFATGTPKDDIVSALEGSIALQFSFILIAQIVSLGLLWLFLKKREISLGQIGIKKPSVENIIYALPGYAIYFILLLLSFALLTNFVPGIDADQQQQVGFETASGAGASRHRPESDGLRGGIRTP